MRYTLDTNILLFYVRDKEARKFIENTYAPFDKNNEAIISIVSVGEIMVLAATNNWSEKKLTLIQKLIDKLIIIELKFEDLIDSYIEIEKYNRNIHPIKKRLGSHIKMGKNDIWIAATAMTTKSILLTADKDFEHLNEVLIKVELVI